MPTPALRAEVLRDTQPSTERVVRLFSGLSRNAIGDFMSSALVRKFAKGCTIVRAGEPGTHLLLLKTGSVDYHRVTPQGKQVLIIRLSPGDTFGLGTLPEKTIGYLAAAETGCGRKKSREGHDESIGRERRRFELWPSQKRQKQRLPLVLEAPNSEDPGDTCVPERSGVDCGAIGVHNGNLG